jgi:hypothetical protein
MAMQRKALIVLVLAAMPLALWLPACKDLGDEQRLETTTDAQLFSLMTTVQPFSRYTLFPNADSVTTGTLNGSGAHQPEVRVSMNTSALGALSNGRLPAGSIFPDGAIIFKRIRSSTQPTVYAVMYKDASNSRAGNSWLWAEFSENGTVLFSIDRRGEGCISCHSREQGLQNDFVRTFERQRP